MQNFEDKVVVVTPAARNLKARRGFMPIVPTWIPLANSHRARAWMKMRQFGLRAPR